MKLWKKIAVGLLAAGMVTGIAACTQADRVSQNISVEADNFNVDRRLVVINTITDSVLLEVIGKFSITADTVDNQLEVTIDTGDGVYKKHYVGMSPTVTYTIEDVSGSDVSNARYQISYLPEAIIPVEIKDGSK